MQAFCRYCQSEHDVIEKPYGGVVLMKCAQCGHWITCQKCRATMATTHTCAVDR